MSVRTLCGTNWGEAPVVLCVVQSLTVSRGQACRRARLRVRRPWRRHLPDSTWLSRGRGWRAAMCVGICQRGRGWICREIGRDERDGWGGLTLCTRSRDVTAPETLRRLWGERQVPDMHWVLRCAYIWGSDCGRTEVAAVQRGQVGERGGEGGLSTNTTVAISDER